MSLVPRFTSSTTLNSHPSSSPCPSTARTKRGSLGRRPGPGCQATRLVAGDIDLQEGDRGRAALHDRVRIHGGVPTRHTCPDRSVRPVLLDRVAVSEGRALERRVHARILHVAVVDLCPFDPVRGNPPPFEHGEAAPDRDQSDPLGSDDRCRRVVRPSRLERVVDAHEQDDVARSFLLPRTEHVGHQTRIQAEPADVGAVTVTGHHAEPALRPGHPAERNGVPARIAQTCRRRLDEHHMARSDRDVVLPCGPLELDGLRPPQRTTGVPFPDTQPDAFGLAFRQLEG